jgi:phosphoribosylaminoimidazolecarboxamide formyltransferase/IMP cyclohydrolase
VVVVNLYPFVKAAANPDTPFDALIEEIDIGGPAWCARRQELSARPGGGLAGRLRAVSSSWIGRRARPPFRFELARKAFAHTASYDTAIASTLAAVTATDGVSRRPQAGLPPVLSLGLRKVRDLRYGENPHQLAALYEGFGPYPGGSLLQGKELSYTNLLDLDAAARIVIDFVEPAAAVIKHTNPCGAATGATAADAYVRARDADALAAFGGIVGLNRPIDVVAAEAIVWRRSSRRSLLPQSMATRWRSWRRSRTCAW